MEMMVVVRPRVGQMTNIVMFEGLDGPVEFGSAAKMVAGGGIANAVLRDRRRIPVSLLQRRAQQPMQEQ